MKNVKSWKAMSSIAARFSSTALSLLRRLRRRDMSALGLCLVHGLERKIAKAIVLARFDHAIEQVKRRGAVGANHYGGGQIIARLQVGILLPRCQQARL